MPYLRTVPPDEATGEVKAMYDKDLAQQGYVANYTRAFSVRPDVEKGWLALKDAITSGMDRRLYELATVAAATAIRSSYCSLVHGRILATSYYSPGTVVSIAAEDTDDSLDAADTAVVRFARKVAREADEDHARKISTNFAAWVLRRRRIQHYSRGGRAVLFQQGVGCDMHAAGRPLRDMPDQLRAALTVGRQIAQQT